MLESRGERSALVAMPDNAIGGVGLNILSPTAETLQQRNK